MPFQKGQSGNPSGRPKGAAGFAANIREETKGGRELWEFALDVMRGRIEVKAISARGVEVNVGPSLKERMDAMKWLADRGFGRPVTDEENEDKAFPFFRQLTEEQVRLYERMVKALPEDSNGEN